MESSIAISRDTEIAARLALTRVLQSLFEEAGAAVDSDPPEYLSDMYCLWRAMQIASVPFYSGDVPDENEETMRQIISDMGDHLRHMQRIYGLDDGLIDPNRGEMIARPTPQRGSTR